MEWIIRKIEKQLDENILPGKVFILFGPRRVGKTVLLQKYVQKKFRNFLLEQVMTYKFGRFLHQKI